jgi:hypothetical protein
MSTDDVLIFALNSPFSFPVFGSGFWLDMCFLWGVAYLTTYIFLTPLFSLSRTPFH